jgi:DNA-binding beta-propeller fold protein YncE
MTIRLSVLCVLLAAAAILVSQPSPREQVGPLPGGGFLLNSGWRITPAGKQVPLDTFPMSSALSKDGKFLLVLNGGYKPPSLAVLRADTMEEIGRTPVEDGWLGLTFSPDGKLVYVGGGSRASVFEFAFADGKLEPRRTLVVVPEKDRKHTDFIGDVTLSPDGRLLYAAGLYHDAIHIINLQTGVLIEKAKTGRRPYRILFHPDGRSFWVSSWADGAVYHHKADTGERIAAIRLGAHPTDMLWRERKPTETAELQQAWTGRLFVAAAHTNSVYVVGVNEAKEMRMIESINISMTPMQPLGMTPSALALNADNSRLFVVCSDANAVAVTDVSEADSTVLGFIPAAWYPTAVRSLPDGRLVVLNGRGLRSHANPQGPNPSRRTAPLHLGGPAPVQYVGRLQTGTASVIDPFDDEQLDKYSDQVLANSPYKDVRLMDAGVPAGNPVPTRPGDPSPIQHVVYIVKENRTYDQVFGDLGSGNGDPSLVLFDKRTTPNHRKLAREYVLFDNFYVNADVSADGHNWSTSAIAPDYVQKMWPNSYGARRRHYDYEGTEPAAYPPAGYIWTNAAAAGLQMRNFGWWCTNGPRAATGEVQIAAVRDPVLAKVTSTKYRAFDMEYPDTDRAQVFIAELNEWEKAGVMPRLTFIRLGNDHTFGAAAGKRSPLAMMADNDLALGTIVEAISKSRFWPSTAIFVLEDDAQNGPDHVDSHRSPAFVISPYTRRGIVDSSMYNTTSMLRTMELILGLRPMTHFDAGARPMWAAFSAKADPAPYMAVKPEHPLDEVNPAATAQAARSARMDFGEADRIDDDEMNDILWRTIRGTEPPPPVRSWFSR